MDAKQLRFIVDNLPKHIPAELSYYSNFHDVLTTLDDIRRAFPYCIAPLHEVGHTLQGWPIYDVSLGTGTLHTIVDVAPHGGELFYLNGSIEHILFLCEHPWLLDGRTVHFLFAGVDEVVCNLKEWAERNLHIHCSGPIGLQWALMRHWRHPHPLHNDAWSYPVTQSERGKIAPTSGAKAGMHVIDAIRHKGEELVAWISGHNRLIGAGVYNIITGPGEVQSSQAIEECAMKLGIPLDTMMTEIPYPKRHPGTKASWEYQTAHMMHRHTIDCEVGGSAYDWAVQFFPNLCIQATEVAMFLPEDVSIWAKTRSAEVASKTAPYFNRLAVITAEAIIMARHLPRDDPYVSAVLALDQPGNGWGIDVSTQPPSTKTLDAHNAFREEVLGPLYRVRSTAVITTMMSRYSAMLKSKGFSPFLLSKEWHGVASKILEPLCKHFVQQPLSPAVTLQILAGEISAYGARGIFVV